MKPKPVANIEASKSSHRIPNAAAAPSGKRPISGRERADINEKWCFSFRYWSQIENFGLGGKDANWFVSLLERLRDISRESVKEIQGDKRKQEVLHYHVVNWGQYNIPIKREDLISLPSDIRNNNTDFPIYQFSISHALGRIAGFWDVGGIFNIVLLDPYHNLQPSKDYDYKVTPTSEMLSEHEILIAKLNLIKNSPANCSAGSCSTQQALKFIDLQNQPFGIVYIDAEYFKMAKALVNDGKAKTVAGLLELGIIAALG